MLSLDAIAQDPTQAATLSAEHRAVLLANAMVVIGALASSNGSTPSVPSSPAPERAMRVGEAASMLNMSRDYIYRHWQKLGGFKDADGRVKFLSGDLRKHIERARRR